MTQKTFNLIDAINREGIDNGIWSLYNCGDQCTSKELFGTLEDVKIEGQVLVLYVRDNDYFCWVKPETADLILTVADDEKLHIWNV